MKERRGNEGKEDKMEAKVNFLGWRWEDGFGLNGWERLDWNTRVMQKILKIDGVACRPAAVGAA